MNGLQQYVLGWMSSLIAYPLAEKFEKRDIKNKLIQLRKYYKLKFSDRKKIMQQRLISITEFAGENVPYYKDLFRSCGFNPSKLHRDIAYIQELPYLTKEIVNEQGHRMLSRNLEGFHHHKMKTGGSTGPSAYIFYDQVAIDRAAAVTLYSRERVGKKKHQFEVHFATRFPDDEPVKKLTIETWKCLAMNRSNIFVDRLDANGLEKIWKTLQEKRPTLIHGHPSTINALSNHVESTLTGTERIFNIFESSGELLNTHQRESISRVLKCKVINRYGLAEFGIVAYELNGSNDGLQVLDSEGYSESVLINNNYEDLRELVFTGYRNQLMPLLRYRTGDLGCIVEREDGFYISDIFGRINDMVSINGVLYSSHYIMDILDHRVGGVKEFQLDQRHNKSILRILPEFNSNKNEIILKINKYLGSSFDIQFVSQEDFIQVGIHSKFRHVVH